MSNAIPTHHRPNLRRLEVHITYRCNLRCNHCSNLITQAPSNETMSLARVDELLADSASLQWPWEWMVLHGGEPTMHPQFEEVCMRFAAYRRDHNPGVEIYLCTNGFGEKVATGIEIAARHGIMIANSGKNGIPEIPYHIAFSVSAVDVGKDYMLGCFQSSLCGISYTNQGFFECSPAGAAHRVFGYEPMAATLAEVTVERLAAGYAEHCKHCGYARVDDPAQITREDKHCQQEANPEAPMSTTWTAAVAAYKERQKQNRATGCAMPK